MKIQDSSGRHLENHKNRDISATVLPTFTKFGMVVQNGFHKRQNPRWQTAAIMKTASKGSPYSITERRVPELIPVLGRQSAGDVSHKPGGRLPLLSARPAVTPETLKRVATNFAAW